jgi:hypothetical protein
MDISECDGSPYKDGASLMTAVVFVATRSIYILDFDVNEESFSVRPIATTVISFSLDIEQDTLVEFERMAMYPFVCFFGLFLHSSVYCSISSV